MKSKRHYKPTIGDVFFVPYNRDLVYDEKGNYYIDENDRGIIVQIIQIFKNFGLVLAFFPGEVKVKDLLTLNLEEKIQQKVEAIHTSTQEGSTKGQWIFLEKLPVSSTMPYQAYKNVKGIITDLEWTIEKKDKKFRKVRFLPYGTWSTASVIPELGRAINGLDTEWEINVEDYRPNPETVLWKIFPEYYSAPK